MRYLSLIPLLICVLQVTKSLNHDNIHNLGLCLKPEHIYAKS